MLIQQSEFAKLEEKIVKASEVFRGRVINKKFQWKMFKTVEKIIKTEYPKMINDNVKSIAILITQNMFKDKLQIELVQKSK